VRCNAKEEEEDDEEQQEQAKGKKTEPEPEPEDTNRKPSNQRDCFSPTSKLNKRGLQKDAIVVQICSWLKLRLISNTALPSRTKYKFSAVAVTTYKCIPVLR
jgi:hypothetical protein